MIQINKGIRNKNIFPLKLHHPCVTQTIDAVRIDGK